MNSAVPIRRSPPPQPHARLKIAFVNSGLGSASGGIGVAAEIMLKALNAEHEVKLWMNDLRYPRLVRQGRIVAKAWLAERPDFVFYAHVYMAAVHAASPRLRHVPYGIFLHGMEIWDPLGPRLRRALENADVLVTNSMTTVERARLANPWLPEARVAWLGIPAGVQPVEAGRQPPVALIIGRLAGSERRKGHDQVLSAWPLVRASLPAARLLVVGEGNDRPRLERRVREEGIPGVEFYGYVSDQRRGEIYRQSRALIFPSRQEGFGLVAIEAASHGLPVLALRWSVFDETFPEGAGAVFAEGLAPRELATPILRLLQDDDFACRAGRAARQRVEQCFTEEHFIERFRQALRPFVP